MADSILPWLSTYLISTGEQFGGQLSKIPQTLRRKKVQLIEFLTYGSENGDECIWAVVSDKIHSISIRFNKEAVGNFTKFNSKRITQHKTAIIVIQHFRPFLSRIPIAGKSTMSLEFKLALECDAFSIVGSSNEAMFGNPKPVSRIPEISAWTAGLRVAGGDGNVLMQRKKDRDAREISVDMPSNQLQQMQIASEHRKPTARKVAAADGLKKRTPMSENRVESHLMKYGNSWRNVSKDPVLKDKTEKVALALKHMVIAGEGIAKSSTPIKPQSPVRETPAPQQSPHERLTDADSSSGDESCRSATPIEWSSTEPRQNLASVSQPDITSNISNPWDNRTPPPSSSSAPTKEQPESLINPSPPPSSPAQVPESSIPSACHHRVVRRVPRPRPPAPPSLVAGVSARILVPNSDTSVAASQSQSQPQPKESSQAIISQAGDLLYTSLSPSLLPKAKSEPLLIYNYEGDRSSPCNNHSATNFTMAAINGDDIGIRKKTNGMNPTQVMASMSNEQEDNHLEASVLQGLPGLQPAALEEDDAQTLILLTGFPIHPTHIAFRGDEPGPSPSPIDENGPSVGIQAVFMSRRVTPADLGNGVQQSMNETHGSRPGIVEHDPIAWAAPTFSREPNVRRASKSPSGSASKTEVTLFASGQQTNTEDCGRVDNDYPILMARVLDCKQTAVWGHDETSRGLPERPGINPACEQNASAAGVRTRAITSETSRSPALIKSASTSNMPRNKSPAKSSPALNWQNETYCLARDSKPHSPKGLNKKPDTSRVEGTEQQKAVVSRESMTKREGSKTYTALRVKRTRVVSDVETDVPTKRQRYDSPSKPLKGKLSGLEVAHMDHLPLSVGGPPRLDWMQLRDILLRTGRDRTQAENGVNVH